LNELDVCEIGIIGSNSDQTSTKILSIQMQKNFENRVDLFDKLKKLGLSDFGELTEISNQGQKKR